MCNKILSWVKNPEKNTSINFTIRSPLDLLIINYWWYNLWAGFWCWGGGGGLVSCAGSGQEVFEVLITEVYLPETAWCKLAVMWSVGGVERGRKTHTSYCLEDICTLVSSQESVDQIQGQINCAGNRIGIYLISAPMSICSSGSLLSMNLLTFSRHL